MRIVPKLLVLLLCLWPSLAPAMETQRLFITTPDGVEHVFTVEVARTPEEQKRGLMFRTTLAADAGMLFIKPAPQPVALWMDNTLLPLDMLFVRADLTLAGIHANAKPLDRTPIRSPGPVIAVIEIAGGQAAARGIVPGSRIRAAALFNPGHSR